MNIWKLILHHEKESYHEEKPTIRNSMLRWTLDEGRIALGWGEVSNLSEYDSSEKWATAIKEIYGNRLPANNIKNGGYSLYNFYHVMKNDDLVILIGKNSRREVVMRIDGNGEYLSQNNSFPDYQHQRRVTKVHGHEEADKLWKQSNGQFEGGRYCTLTRLIIPNASGKI